MLQCGIARHDGQCSFAVAAEPNPHLAIVGGNDITPADTILYGTSDPTINPAEVWMTAYAAARYGAWWQFFTYPLAPRWIHHDLKITFAPHSVPYIAEPRSAIDLLGLPDPMMTKLVTGSLQEALAGDTVLNLTLEEVITLVRRHRHAKSFCVLNLMQPDGRQVRLFCSHRRRIRYRPEGAEYRRASIGEIFSKGEEKFGGAILYFLAGCLAARRDLIILLPHIAEGDVWGATAAGAAFVGKSARLLPVGHLDLLTARQWEIRRRFGAWRKAPPEVIRRLEVDPIFREALVTAIFEEQKPVSVSYDEENDRFSFVSC